MLRASTVSAPSVNNELHSISHDIYAIFGTEFLSRNTLHARISKLLIPYMQEY